MARKLHNQLTYRLLSLIIFIALSLAACYKKETIVIAPPKPPPRPTPAVPISVLTDISTQIGNFIITGGIILPNGETNITAEGVCWSKKPKPRLEIAGDSVTNNGSNPRQFKSIIPNLPPGVYYICAYASDTAKRTGYGQDVIINVIATPVIGVTLMKSSSLQPQEFYFGTGQAITYDSVVFNSDTSGLMLPPLILGAAYDRIVAGVSGLYGISTTMKTTDSLGSYMLYLLVNGGEIGENYAYMSNNLAAFTHLNKFDVVQMYMYSNGDDDDPVICNATSKPVRLDMYLIHADP